jgi:hypothetical protein
MEPDTHCRILLAVNFKSMPFSTGAILYSCSAYRPLRLGQNRHSEYTREIEIWDISICTQLAHDQQFADSLGLRRIAVLALDPFPFAPFPCFGDRTRPLAPVSLDDVVSTCR